MLSSGLSGTFNMMHMKASLTSDLEIRVFDSLSGSLGTGATVLQLARYIEEGVAWEELLRRAEILIANTHVFFSVDTLEYLRKGGRIGRITALAGSMLQIKPILTFTQGGKLSVVDKVRGMRRVFAYALEKMERLEPVEEGRVIHVVHTDAERDAEELASLIEQRWGTKPEVSIMGPVIGAHVGPGAVAVLWKTKEERND